MPEHRPPVGTKELTRRVSPASADHLVRPMFLCNMPYGATGRSNRDRQDSTASRFQQYFMVGIGIQVGRFFATSAIQALTRMMVEA
jgi:hypothetical protein